MRNQMVRKNNHKDFCSAAIDKNETETIKVKDIHRYKTIE